MLAVVTGGASGIGAAVTELLLKQGWAVHVVDLKAQYSGGASYQQIDVTSESELVSATAALGNVPVNALVCAAGIWDRDGDGRFDRVSSAAWERTLAVNLTGTMLSLRAFYPLLVPGSSVVTIGSIAGLVGLPGLDAYTASKGALIALTRAWAQQLAHHEIRVNCICPGVTETPMIAKRPRTDVIQLPLGRPADPEEIAGAVAFLCSAASSYLSGAVVPVDGGLVASSAGMQFPASKRPR